MFYTLFETLMNLAIWNTIWLAHTILGLGIFGWAPATAALFSVLRKEKLDQREVPKWRTFFIIYKREFIKTNIIGFLVVGGGAAFLFSFNTLLYMEYGIRILFGTLLVILFIMYFLTSLYIFPVSVHYNTSLMNHIRFALMIGLAYLPHSLLIGITIVLIGMIYQIFPGLIMFYLMSFPVAVILPIVLHVFKLIEEKEVLQESM
jgi:uncharacterized membrane protein YesL